MTQHMGEKSQIRKWGSQRGMEGHKEPITSATGNDA